MALDTDAATTQQTSRLQTFLSLLPEATAARLAAAVERDRLAGAGHLPHEQILTALEPAILQKRSRPRAWTAQRLWCVAFEDVLITERYGPKMHGRIARAAIQPVWSWLETALLKERFQGLTRDISTCLKAGDSAGLKAAVAKLQRASGKAMLTALHEGAGPGPARSEALRADATEMAQLLLIGPELHVLQDLLPRPVERLSGEHMTLIRAAYDGFLEHHPKEAAYIPLIVMARLARPWEALRVMRNLNASAGGTATTEPHQHVMAEVLAADAGEEAEGLKRLLHEDFDPWVIASRFGIFSRKANGLLAEASTVLRGWDSAGLRTRLGEISARLGTLIAHAPGRIMAAFPQQEHGRFGRRLGPQPDLSRAVPARTEQAAERSAQLLRELKTGGPDPLLADGLVAAAREAAQRLRAYRDALTRAMSSPLETIRNEAEHRFSAAQRLLALLEQAA